MSGTSVSDARRTTALPERWSSFLSGEKCSIWSRLAVADDHVGVALEDRADQLGDVRAEVLVVGVGVDDQVGAELQAGVEARLEARGEPLVVGEADDVVDAARARDLDGAVGRAVVDDSHSTWSTPGSSRGRSRERPGQRLLLVEAGDLDDQLHAAPSVA